MICKNCGKEIDDDLNFCTYCGAKIKKSDNNPLANIDLKKSFEKVNLKKPFEKINFNKDSKEKSSIPVMKKSNAIIIGIVLIALLGVFFLKSVVVKNKCIDLVKEHEFFGYTTERILNGLTSDGSWTCYKKEGQNRVTYSGHIKQEIIDQVKEAFGYEDYDMYYYEDDFYNDEQEVSDETEEILATLGPDFKVTFKVDPRSETMILYTIENDGRIIPVEDAKNLIMTLSRFVSFF